MKTHRRSSTAWLHPDFDLSGYTRICFQGAGIAYRPVRASRARGAATEPGQTTERSSSRAEQPLMV